MNTIYSYLAADHQRLDKLFCESTVNVDEVNMNAYSDFRKGLLRHIGLEEKILFPAILNLHDEKDLAVIKQLRLGHGALVALLVPSPGRSVIDAIRSILEDHNKIEESDSGVYRKLDVISDSEKNLLLQKLLDAPEVPALPHNDRPGIIDATRRAVERAGYLEVAKRLI